MSKRDVRVKTFVAEATARLEFLQTEHGFTGPTIEPSEPPDLRRRLVLTVSYGRRDLVAMTSLVFDYMGDERLLTVLLRGDGSGSDRQRTVIGDDRAHTGYQMRRALDRQADAIRAAVSSPLGRWPQPPRRGRRPRRDRGLAPVRPLSAPGDA